MGKLVEAAQWLAVVVAIASSVSGQQVGKGWGKDNISVVEAFTSDNFNCFFPNINSPLAHAQGFWDWTSFVTAAGLFAKEGLFLKGGSAVQKQEIAAFLANVAHETSCGYSGAVGGPFDWGLCYKEELSPSSIYCTSSFDYPCVQGVSYHGRGGFPIYYNTNYGPVGNALKIDLLSNPGVIATNATLAWAAAMWYWVTPQKPNPSAHSVIVGEWKPTKADLDAFRYPGLGLAINILDGQNECGHGDDPDMDDRTSFYLEYISILLEAPGDNLSCGEQGVLPVGYTAVK